MSQSLVRTTRFVLVAVMVIGLTAVAFRWGQVRAEQIGGSPESGTTSRLRSLYTTLQGLSYGSDTDTPDWGTFWNRIKTAATWQPSGNAGAAGVISGYTFYSNSRTQQTGTYNVTNLSAANVKNGTSFGTGQTGTWPSASNPLTGATGTDAIANDIHRGLVAWDKTGTVISGTYPAPSSCSTQPFADNYGAPVTQTTNCTVDTTWTVPSDGITGTDHKDPVTGLIWSEPLYNNSGSLEFSALNASNWSWNGQTTFTVSSANATAGAVYSTTNGSQFTVVTTISAGTTLVTTANGAASGLSGTLTKVSGTGDATITFTGIPYGSANAVYAAKTAAQLCTSKGNGWRLPSQKELMQAYIDGSYFNLNQPSGNFWSQTETSGNAWATYLSTGVTNTSAENTSNWLRCVR